MPKAPSLMPHELAAWALSAKGAMPDAGMWDAKSTQPNAP